MGYVTGVDRRTALGSLEDEVPQDSSVRFIEVFVDSLDLEEQGFEHAILAPTGRPPYHPGDLLKLFIYGYLNRIRSSRRLRQECTRNIELFSCSTASYPTFAPSPTSGKSTRARCFWPLFAPLGR